MKALISILLLALIMACNRQAVPTREIRVEKRDSLVLIRDTVVAIDSASMQAYITCDSLGRVYLSEVNMLQGKLLALQLDKRGNYIKVKANSSKKERVEQRSTTANTQVVYKYVDKKLTYMQCLYMRAGKVTLLVLLPLALLYIIIRYRVIQVIKALTNKL